MRAARKADAVYTTRCRAFAISRNSHISNTFYRFVPLTLFKTGTYTLSMIGRSIVRRAALVATLGIGLSPIATAALLAQSRERSMYVSVVDQNGKPIPDLGPGDFLIKEDNVTREVLRVVPAIDPMQIAVLVDTSASAREHIPHIRQALPPFVTALTGANEAGRRNEVALIGIGERPTILAEYALNARDLQKGIDRIWSIDASGMYLLDAVIEVSQGLKKREALRPVIVAIATEGTDFSNRHHDQALDPVKSINAAFYALMIGRPNPSLSTEARERAIFLDEGTRTTGGSHEQLLTSMSLGPKLTLLADQLMHQYKVTYGRPESLIPPEKITVSAAKAGMTARGTPVKEARP